MMESKTKRPQHLPAVVLVPGSQRVFLVASRAGTDGREGGVGGVDGVGDEGQVRRAGAGFEPGVDVGVEV